MQKAESFRNQVAPCGYQTRSSASPQCWRPYRSELAEPSQGSSRAAHKVTYYLSTHTIAQCSACRKAKYFEVGAFKRSRKDTGRKSQISALKKTSVNRFDEKPSAPYQKSQVRIHYICNGTLRRPADVFPRRFASVDSMKV